MYVPNKLASLFIKLIILGGSAYAVLTGTQLLSGTAQPAALLTYPLFFTALLLLYYLYAVLILTASIVGNGIQGHQAFSASSKGLLVVGSWLGLGLYLYQHATGLIPAWSSNDLLPLITQVLLPVFVMMDYLLFDRKGRMMPADPFIWLIPPVLYVGLVNICPLLFPAVGQPNPFGLSGLNFVRAGLRSALISALVLMVILVAAGYLLFVADKMMGASVKRKKRSQQLLRRQQGEEAPEAAAAASTNETPAGADPAVPGALAAEFGGQNHQGAAPAGPKERLVWHRGDAPVPAEESSAGAEQLYAGGAPAAEQQAQPAQPAPATTNATPNQPAADVQPLVRADESAPGAPVQNYLDYEPDVSNKRNNAPPSPAGAH